MLMSSTYFHFSIVFKAWRSKKLGVFWAFEFYHTHAWIVIVCCVSWVLPLSSHLEFLSGVHSALSSHQGGLCLGLEFKLWMLKVLQDFWSRKCLLFTNHWTSSSSISIIPITLVIFPHLSWFVMWIQVITMQLHPPCISFQGLCVHCLLKVLC